MPISVYAIVCMLYVSVYVSVYVGMHVAFLLSIYHPWFDYFRVECKHELDWKRMTWDVVAPWLSR